VALEETKIGSTDPNIPKDINCMDDKLHFAMPVGSGDCEHKGYESDMRNPIPTASRRRRPVPELERFDQVTSEVDRYDGEDGDNADADEGEEASQADHGSMQMWRTEGIVHLTWAPVMSMGISVSLGPMRVRMRTNYHRKPIMDQPRMWRTEDIVLQSVKIGLYSSHL
jgi:hypothetical protein